MVKRADRIQRSARIPETVENLIRQSDLVIVEISEDNPNVLYELGMADHAGKEFILLAEKTRRKSLPTNISDRQCLFYSEEDLNGLKSTLSQWLRQTSCYRLRQRQAHSSANVMNRGEIFAAISDAAFYIWPNEKGARDTILRELRRGQIISSANLYRSFRGTRNWLELCRDADYHVYRKSLDNLNEIINNLIGELPETFMSKAPDIISLGPGNGCKDRLILRAIIEKLEISQTDEHFYYYPYDISFAMISSALDHICNRNGLSDKDLIKRGAA